MENHSASSLHLAVEFGDEDIVKIFLSVNVDVNSKECRHRRTPLHIAAEHDRCEIARLLLEHEAHVDDTSDDNLTALHIAVANRSRPMVELLLEYGANVNPASKFWGKTPLYLAVERGCAEMAELLLVAGASIGDSTIRDTTIFDVARRIGDRRLSSLLLEYAGERVRTYVAQLQSLKASRNEKPRRGFVCLETQSWDRTAGTMVVRLLTKNPTTPDVA